MELVLNDFCHETLLKGREKERERERERKKEPVKA